MSRRAATIALFVLAIAVGAVLVSVIRGLTFLQDEWVFIVSRRELGLETLLRPHNEHWQSLPILAYQVSFLLRGLGSYGLLGAISTTAHLFAATMLFAVLARRVHPWLALVGAVGLLLFAWSDEVLLWPVNLSFSLPVGFGLAAVLAWDRDRPNARTDALGALAMIAGLASGSVAIVFLAVATAYLAARRPPVSRLLWPAASTAVFVAWYLSFGRSSSALGEAAALDPAHLPSFVANGLATLAARLLGVDYRFQLVSVIAIAACLGASLARLRDRRTAFWIPFLGLLSLYALIGLARLATYDVGGAAAPRYLYPAAALAFLAFVPLFDEVRRASRGSGRRLLWLCFAIWAVAVIAGDVGKFTRSAEVYTLRASEIRAELRTLQVLRPALEATPAADRTIDRAYFFALTPGALYAAIDDLSAPIPGASVESLVGLPREQRVTADALIGRLIGTSLRPIPVTTDPPDRVFAPIDRLRDPHHLERVASSAACARYRVVGIDPFLSVRLRPGERLWIWTDGDRTLQVFGRVLADEFGEISASLFPERGLWYVVEPAPLVPGMAWKIRVDPPRGSRQFQACLEPMATR